MSVVSLIRTVYRLVIHQYQIQPRERYIERYRLDLALRLNRYYLLKLVQIYIMFWSWVSHFWLILAAFYYVMYFKTLKLKQINKKHVFCKKNHIIDHVILQKYPTQRWCENCWCGEALVGDIYKPFPEGVSGVT